MWCWLCAARAWGACSFPGRKVKPTEHKDWWGVVSVTKDVEFKLVQAGEFVVNLIGVKVSGDNIGF